jgi:hypothetical protein
MIGFFKINTMGETLHTAAELERRLAELVPLKHFMATGFARNGLFLLARALGWDASTEVLVPAFTCPVIRHAIESAGAKAVPVDAEPDGLNLDPELAEKAVTGGTRAIYVVHTYGTAARMEQLCALAKRHNLVVIEDVAHAPFYRYRGRQLGTWGDFAIYSFTKKSVNYEGGAVGTNNTAVHNAMMALREQYQRDGALTAAGAIDGYVRLVGSWWESGFSVAALFLMKLNDLVNRALFRGAYGVSIDPGKFMPRRAACRITLRQLDSLRAAADGNGGRYRAFRERAGSAIRVYGTLRDAADTLPRYYTGLLDTGGALMRLISFRTWRNSNPPGEFPRADYLYGHYRVFSKAILLFMRRGKRQAPAGRVTAPGRGRVSTTTYRTRRGNV